MIKQFLNLGKFLTKKEQVSITGGLHRAVLHCEDGTSFCINPNTSFSPQEMCSNYGGFDKMTYVEVE